MNHKSIIKIISNIFFISIIFSVLSLFSKMFINPELIFLIGFIILTITCILFFHTSEKKALGGNKSLTTVINKDLYIYYNTKSRKLRRLFIKVSILFM